MERAKRREWEAEYVSEYTREVFKGVPVIFHMKLGTWPTPLTAEELSAEEQAMLRVRMRWADALVIQPDRLIVIEGKLRPSEFLKGYGELKLYVHLVPHTPELERFKDRKVTGRLVTTIPDPTVEYLCRKENLEYDVFQPTFWAEYMDVLAWREKRAKRPEEATLLEGE